MANPQKEDGHVDIANEIMDALAKIRIPGEARQVLDFILRKTYGWHKKEDSISLSQFERGTGLKRSNVCQCLKRLLKMNLIYKGSSEKDTGSSELHTTHIQVYGFQKDFERWRVVVKRIPSMEITTKGSMEMGNRVVPNSIHTKETIQKKTNKRNINISDEDFLSSLKEKFTWIDFDQVMTKMDAWLLAHPGRKKTRRFIVNWLNKIERPMEIQKHSGLRSWGQEIMEEEDGRER